MRPATVNFTPYLDETTSQNVSFTNLPLDAGVHRDLTTASNIPPQAAGPQTALVGATYIGAQSAPVSPDTPAKSTPDDTTYSAPSGGVLAAVNLQVLAGQLGLPSLSIDLDDGNPNSPGSGIVVFTGTDTTTIDLAESDLGDGFHGEGITCLPLGPLPPLSTPPPPPGGPVGTGNLSVAGPQQVTACQLPPASVQTTVQIAQPDSPRSEGGAAGTPAQVNVVDTSSSPPGLGPRFDGMDTNSNPFLPQDRVDPPDAQLAVGADHIVEFINVIGRIYMRPGSMVECTFRLRNFFGLPTTYRESDPKVLYDDLSHRWFAAYLSWVDNPSGQADEGRLYIAVSADTVPEKWNVYYISYTDVLPDYPAIGITSDKVTLSSNLFDIDVLAGGLNSCPGNRGYCGEQTVVFEKADLLAGASSPRNVPLPVHYDRQTTRPAQSLSPVNDQYLVTRRKGSFVDSGFCDPAYDSFLTVIRITGTPAAGPVTEASAFDRPINNQTQPPNHMLQADSAGQPTDFPDVKIDCRYLDASWRESGGIGRLWASANTGCLPAGDTATRTCAHLIEVNTGNTTVSQDIVYGLAQNYYIYPALRTDVAGNLYVSFTRSNQTIHPESRLVGRHLSDAPNSLTGQVLLRADDWPYFGRSRWGDYLAAAVDPATPNCVWLIGEYSKHIDIQAENWGTYIAASSFGGDSDCDTWSDAAEAAIGTNPFSHCGPNAWPPDINSDGAVDITGDISVVGGFAFQPVPPGPRRYDIAPDPPDGNIDVIGDIARMASLFARTCLNTGG